MASPAKSSPDAGILHQLLQAVLASIPLALPIRVPPDEVASSINKLLVHPDKGGVLVLTESLNIFRSSRECFFLTPITDVVVSPPSC